MNNIFITHARIESPEDLESGEYERHSLQADSLVLLTDHLEATPSNKVKRVTELHLDPGDPEHVINAVLALAKVLLQNEHANIRVYGSMVEEGVRRAHELSQVANDDAIQAARKSFLANIRLPEDGA